MQKKYFNRSFVCHAPGPVAGRGIDLLRSAGSCLQIAIAAQAIARKKIGFKSSGTVDRKSQKNRNVGSQWRCNPLRSPRCRTLMPKSQRSSRTGMKARHAVPLVHPIFSLVNRASFARHSRSNTTKQDFKSQSTRSRCSSFSTAVSHNSRYTCRRARILENPLWTSPNSVNMIRGVINS